MAADLILTAEAEQDIADAGDWAERQRRGRGAKLVERVNECVAAVRRTPKAFTPYHGDYRRAVVRHFPYVVVYGYDEPTDIVTVYAVFHTSQDPDRLP